MHIVMTRAMHVHALTSTASISPRVSRSRAHTRRHAAPTQRGGDEATTSAGDDGASTSARSDEQEIVAAPPPRGSKKLSRSASSVEVQRALARRLLDAQTRWVGSTEFAHQSSQDEDDFNAVELNVNEGIFSEAYTRGRWLLGLLVLQSTSSVVLGRYEDLIRDNIIVTLFLTMLVGAGGNAGNQSAIHVIRGLATGEMTPTMSCLRKTLGEQVRVGLLLGTGLACGGFVRVLLTNPSGSGDFIGPFAIASSLFAIVTTSTVVGTVLPFALRAMNQDEANAGTTVQVVMDVSGVLITCFVSSFFFEHAQEWGVFAA